MTPRRKRLLLIALLSSSLGMGCCGWGNDLLRALQDDSPSRSRGRLASGSLLHGKRLPSAGANFTTYSRLGSLLGRSSTHSAYHDVILAAYARLEREQPQLRFVYGELGWPGGGEFWPHRSHQNGLSADFMVPLRADNGEVSTLPCWPWTGFGYGLDFDKRGELLDYPGCVGCRIDFDALAAHLLAIQAEAKARGHRIHRVILAPDLRRALKKGARGKKLRRIPFLERKSWVRHDDHYHVDLAL